MTTTDDLAEVIDGKRIARYAAELSDVDQAPVANPRISRGSRALT